jgi:hypothetical protein
MLLDKGLEITSFHDLRKRTVKLVIIGFKLWCAFLDICSPTPWYMWDYWYLHIFKTTCTLDLLTELIRERQSGESRQ